VREFGPLKLEAFQAFLVTKDWARTTINMAVGRVRRMFRWAVAKQLIAADILHALQAVAPLKRGRTTAREPKPIRPVALEVVAATLPHLPTPVRAMVQVQLATGMRPGEVCILRTQGVDRSVSPWRYLPARHKTEIHGKTRAIFIGPEAQAALALFLRDDEPSAYVFRPADSMKELHEERTAARKTPLRYGNRPGTNRKRKPKRTPSARYVPTAYARCIARACEASEIQHWHPNQLRHTAATRIRAMFGVEAASNVLGHSNLATTELYAEVNERRAAEIALKVG
jgi:integrase